MATKQQAPPPPVGFTGEVPRRRFGEVVREKWQARQAGRPRRPLSQINTGPQPATRRSGPRVGARSGPRARRYRRRPKRGTLFAIFSVVVAACALTAAVVEFSAWEVAAEVGTAAEFVSFGTAWFFGDPRSNRPPKTPKPPRAKGNPAPGSTGQKCGAPTQDKNNPNCGNPVTAAGEKCWRHQGSSSGPSPKTTSPKQTGPKKTRKAAPPPVTP